MCSPGLNRRGFAKGRQDCGEPKPVTMNRIFTPKSIDKTGHHGPDCPVSLNRICRSPWTGFCSGNVFADLKVKNADEHDLKSTLGIMIIKLMREKNIKQTSAATLFGITQPEVSRLKGGNLSHYSVERLLGFLTKLNQRIEIKISPSNWRKAAEIVLV